MDTRTRSVRNLFAAIGSTMLLAVVSIGCTGPTGAAGASGQDGAPGQNGKDKGTIGGLLTITGSTTAAAGVNVLAMPGNFATTTGSDGKYILQVPIGIYTMTFGAGINVDGFDPVMVQGVNVIGSGSVTVNASVVQSNPLIVTPTGAIQAGFNKTVRLGVTVSGVPSGATPSFAWTQTSGPPVTITGASTTQPTFVTRKIGEVITANLTNLKAPVRKGPVAMSTQYETELSYGLKVTVTAGPFIKSATTTVTSAAVTAGAQAAVPIGVNVILGSPAQSSYVWAITAAPAGSNAAFDLPHEQFAAFVPDREGQYTVTESGTGAAYSETFTVGSYKGASFCTVCHGAIPSLVGAEQVAKWRGSLHKSMFQRGITGVASDHYSSSCITCHTTGDFMNGTIKGGFGDVATQLGWHFPSTLTPANWTNLPDPLKDLGGISCESCHGPGSQHMASPDRISKGMSNNVCNQCHMAVGHHDRGYLASKGAHSNLQLTLDEATVEGRGDTAGHCGRCHSAQGFKQYIKQLQDTSLTQAERIAPLIKPATYTGTMSQWLSSLGLTRENVDNPGCPTCHEPHGLTLRLEGSTPLLPAGFAVSEAGKGAVCMSCHNTRNGLHDDQHAPTSTSAPHTPSQTDVLAGKNAYFVSTSYALSRHAAAQDTCATCHVAEPVSGLSILPPNYSFGGTNHTFMVNSSICKSCHSADVTGEALQAEVDQGLADITRSAARVLVENYLRPIVNPGFVVTAYDEASDRYSAPVTITALPAVSSSVSFALEIHGQESACMTLPAPIQVTWTGDPSPSNITNLCFQMSSLKQLDGSAVVPANSTLIKALWNYYLVKGDGSRGIHNPTFVFQILTNTQAALNPG